LESKREENEREDSKQLRLGIETGLVLEFGSGSKCEENKRDREESKEENKQDGEECKEENKQDGEEIKEENKRDGEESVKENKRAAPKNKTHEIIWHSLVIVFGRIVHVLYQVCGGTFS
jgi:hypothetical protein